MSKNQQLITIAILLLNSAMLLLSSYGLTQKKREINTLKQRLVDVGEAEFLIVDGESVQFKLKENHE